MGVVLAAGVLLAGRAGAQRGVTDANAFARRLATSPSQRGPFETTAAYRARLAIAQRRALGPDSVYVFTLGAAGSDDDCGTTIGYDADSAALVIRFRATRPAPMLAPPVAELPLACVKREQGSYIAANAFGAAVRVHRSRFESTAVALDQPSLFGFAQPWVVPLSPDVARALLPSLRIRASFALRSDSTGALVRTSTEAFDPKWDSPEAFTITTHMLLTNAVTVALVDVRNGRRYATGTLRYGPDAPKAATIVTPR